MKARIGLLVGIVALWSYGCNAVGDYDNTCSAAMEGKAIGCTDAGKTILLCSGSKVVE